MATARPMPERGAGDEGGAALKVVLSVGGGHGNTVPPAHAPFDVEISNVALYQCEDLLTTPIPSDSRGAAAARARREADAIRRVGTALMARQRQIGRAITARILDELPEYGEASEQVQADLLVGATEVAGLLAGSFAGGRALRREDAAGVRELAARRVHQGVELDVFLHAYRVALFAFWDACAEEAERLRLPRSAGYALARAAIEAIDIVTTQAAQGFLREETEYARAAAARPVTSSNGSSPGARPIRATGSPRHPAWTPTPRSASSSAGCRPRTNYPATRCWSPVMCSPSASGRRSWRCATASSSPSRVRSASRTSAVRADALAHGIDVRFGLGLPSAGFAGVERAYREAVLCLARATPARPVVVLGDLPALETAMAGTDTTARAVIAAKAAGVRALEPSDRDIAIDTIRAFAAADLNVARAATTLHVHQNTVRHRLDRINATTGHDPRTFRGLVDLLCAVETLNDTPSQAQ